MHATLFKPPYMKSKEMDDEAVLHVNVRVKVHVQKEFSTRGRATARPDAYSGSLGISNTAFAPTLDGKLAVMWQGGHCMSMGEGISLMPKLLTDSE
jgi:hypothetical protein